MSTFALILSAAIVLALIGFILNRSRTNRGNSRDGGGAYYTHHSDYKDQRDNGDMGGRDVSHDSGGSDGGWGDSGSGGDSGGGDGGGGE